MLQSENLEEDSGDSVCWIILTGMIFSSGGSDEQIFETKIVPVGKEMKLTCPRREVGTLFWIKLVSGDFAKILGRSFSFESVDQRIRTATETGAFVLYITKARQSDTGVYFCMKTGKQDFKILNGIFLKVEGKYTKTPLGPTKIWDFT